MGERIRGELQRKAEGRTPGPGGLLHSAGGAGADRAIPAVMQPHQAPRFPGLPATSTGSYSASSTCSGAGRSNIGGTTIWAGQLDPHVSHDRSEPHYHRRYRWFYRTEGGERDPLGHDQVGNPKHVASGLALSPNNRITGSGVNSSRTKPAATRAALRLAAYGVHRFDSALGAFLCRKKEQLRALKGVTVTAHKLARIIYSMLRYDRDYGDASAEFYEGSIVSDPFGLPNVGKRNWAINWPQY